MPMDVTASLDLSTVSQDPINPPFDNTLIHRGRLRDGRTVAIKTPRHHRVREIWTSFLDMWTNCHDPNVVQLIGKVTFEGELAGVYEWHEYDSVPQYLKQHPATDRYQLSAQICEGIASLHANDIIHGDLSCDQIRASSDGVPRIQLSVLASTSVIGAHARTWLGHWRAPEIKRESKRTFASDVYSLGMTILECITRSNLNNHFGYLVPAHEKALRGEAPPRPSIIPQNAAGNIVWDMLCKCLSFNPEHRPSARDVCDVMHSVYQSPDGLALRAVRLVVTELTTIRDLVAHFDKRGVPSYTDLLYSTNAVSTVSIADTALANVYRVDFLCHRPVAVKWVKHSTPYKRLKRAARELDCWVSHKHPYILPVIGFAAVRADLGMVSPWMGNGCVTDYVNRNPGCDRPVLCAQLAQAVAYLHENNVVHGDIKGPNVLISDAGTVQVADFGVSIVDHQEIEFTATSSGRGTQRWQAPEILQGQTDSTMEADVYALGMTMIEIYTGQQPYGSEPWPRLLIPVITGQRRPPRPIQLPIDEAGNGVWALMSYCWAGVPGERPTSAWVNERLQYYSSRQSHTGGIWG